MGSSSSTRRRAPGGLTAASAATGVVFAAPLGYVLWRNIDLRADFGDVVWSSNTLDPLRRSLVLGASVSISAAVLGTALAWLIVRSDLPGRRLWRVVAPLPLVFPSFVGASALISGFATGGLLERVVQPLGVDSLPELSGFRAAWFVLTLFTYPYVYLPVAARLRRLPASLEESARLLGRRPASVFATIVLPQTRTAVSAGTLLVFLYTVSDFGAVELLRHDTLTRAIYANRLVDQPTSMALSLLLGLVAIGVVAAERALVRRDPPLAAHSGGSSMQVSLGHWRWPALAAVVAFVGFAIVGPVSSLAYWTIRGIDSTRSTGSLAVSAEGLGGAVSNTVIISVVTAVATVIAVLPIAYLTTRYRNRVGDAANGLVVGGFALPGLVTALALVFWVLNTPALAALYQTLPILLLAYVIHFGAVASRASQVAVASVPLPVEDAARMLGAGRVRRFLTIETPLMARGLIAAAGLVLLSAMKELPATLLLAPIGFDTLATRIWAAMDTVSYAQAGLESMVLLAVSAVLTWLFVIRAADRLD